MKVNIHRAKGMDQNGRRSSGRVVCLTGSGSARERECVKESLKREKRGWENRRMHPFSFYLPPPFPMACLQREQIQAWEKRMFSTKSSLRFGFIFCTRHLIFKLKLCLLLTVTEELLLFLSKRP